MQRIVDALVAAMVLVMPALALARASENPASQFPAGHLMSTPLFAPNVASAPSGPGCM